ncbi:MAG TPA: hypothetical protein VNZ44_12055 [Pyrinomonadaceae bacterium]|nr:hypothetical protein [Pyrinomonadaceae bacterium]
MPCPVCSSESVFEAARRRKSGHAREDSAQFTSEVLNMAQEVRDISSRLRHKTADLEAADMLDDLARRMAHACRETTHA